MSIKNLCAGLLGVAVVLGGCTSRSGKQIEVGPQASGGGGAGQAPVPTHDVQPGVQPDVQAGAKVPGAAPVIGDGPSVVLNEAVLKQQYSVDTNNLNYKFTYLAFSQAEKIVFAGGNATLNFKDLPAGQSGTMQLDIYEGQTLKLRSSAAGIVLNKGQNNTIKLPALVAVDPTGATTGTVTGPTTDLTVNVTLDNGGTTPPTTTGGGTTPTGGTTTTPSDDPIAKWDGKKNLDNGRWTIVAVP